jgi:tight adherence protein C
VSIAVLLATAAGTCAAAAVAEWLGAPRRARSTADREAATAPLSHVGGMTVLLARLARRAGVRAAPGDLEARISAAGAPLGLAVGDVIALKGAAVLGLALFVLPFAGLLPGRLGIAALVAAPVAGYFTPQLVLARLARARGQRIAGELADVLDLLRVAVGAGLPVGRALGEVGRRMSGVLAAELDGAAARMQLGAARGDVLRELVARCPATGVATLAAAIARADLHGAALTPALEALAAEARAEQARGLRDAAARAAPKIQLVVALVLVPAVMLLIGAVLVQGIGA